MEYFIRTLEENLSKVEGFADRDMVVDYLRGASVKYGEVMTLVKRYATSPNVIKLFLSVIY